jgi:hypothetical protein
VDRTGSEEYEEGIWIAWEGHYQVIQCQGCDALSFRHLSWFSEHEDPTSGSDGRSERLYPKRDATSLKTHEFWNAPITLRRIYRESIESFNNECFTLCAAGLRGLVEGICADQKVSDGPIEKPAKGGGTKIVRAKDLEGKLAGLCEKGMLTKPHAETLHAHRYLGNEAVHELAQPSYNELKLADWKSSSTLLSNFTKFQRRPSSSNATGIAVRCGSDTCASVSLSGRNYSQPSPGSGMTLFVSTELNRVYWQCVRRFLDRVYPGGSGIESLRQILFARRLAISAWRGTASAWPV